MKCLLAGLGHLEGHCWVHVFEPMPSMLVRICMRRLRVDNARTLSFHHRRISSGIVSIAHDNHIIYCDATFCWRHLVHACTDRFGFFSVSIFRELR